MYMKYNEWLLEWLVSYEKPSKKSRTYTKYKDIVEKRLIPRFGEYDLTEITPLMVQRYIAELTESGNQKTGEGLSSNSINSIISVIQKSMNTAYLVGYVDTYDMNKIKRPKTQESPVECFTLEEQRRIELAVLQDKRVKMKGIVLCLYTRIVEARNLSEDDKWMLSVALDGIRDFSEKDIAMILKEGVIFDYHFSYGMYVRSRYVHPSKLHTNYIADDVSERVAEFIYAILLPNNSCF